MPARYAASPVVARLRCRQRHARARELHARRAAHAGAPRAIPTAGRSDFSSADAPPSSPRCSVPRRAPPSCRGNRSDRHPPDAAVHDDGGTVVGLNGDRRETRAATSTRPRPRRARAGAHTPPTIAISAGGAGRADRRAFRLTFPLVASYVRRPSRRRGVARGQRGVDRDAPARAAVQGLVRQRAACASTAPLLRFGRETTRARRESSRPPHEARSRVSSCRSSSLPRSRVAAGPSGHRGTARGEHRHQREDRGDPRAVTSRPSTAMVVRRRSRNVACSCEHAGARHRDCVRALAPFAAQPPSLPLDIVVATCAPSTS